MKTRCARRREHFARLFGPQPRRPLIPFHRRLQLEPLEHRHLLSGSPPVAVDDVYTTGQDTVLVVHPEVPEEYVVSFDDFESGVSGGWSATTTSVTPVGARTFLGEFAGEQVSLQLNELPPHDEVTVEFEFFVLKSWDGNSPYYGPDIWRLEVDGGLTLLNATFDNVNIYGQSYPDPYGGGSHQARTGAAESNTLGYDYYHGDAVYDLEYRFDHASDALQLNFVCAGDNEGIDDESWGLDNVRVSVPGWALGVLANDLDSDWDSLTSQVVSGPSHGSVTLNPDGTFEYVPDAGYAGVDSFTYVANDGTADSEEATVTVTVNDAPLGRQDSYTAQRGTALDISAGDGVLANDFDRNGDPLEAILVDPPDHGTVTLAADGSFVYEPDDYYVGHDTFTYKAADAVAASEATAVTIEVVYTDEDSLAADDFYSVTADGLLQAALVNGAFETGDLTGWTTFTMPGGTIGAPAFPDVVAYDVDGDSVATESVQFLVGDGGGGIYQEVTLAGGTVKITADVASQAALADPEGGLFELLFDGQVVAAHDFGSMTQDQTKRAELVATLSDVSGGEHEVRVRVTRSGSASYGATPFSFIDNIEVFGDAGSVLVNDAGSAHGMRALLVSWPQNGTLEFHEDGSFEYVPNPGFVGEDSFVYKMVEGAGGLTLFTVDIANDKLVAIDSATGALTVFGPIGHDMFGTDIAYLNGLIYAETDNDGDTFNSSGHTLVVIDPLTGAKVHEAPLTRDGFSWAESLAADDRRLYLGHNNGAIGIVDPLTGAITEAVAFQGRDFDGLAVDNDGYLVSVDGINYSGSTRQIAFHRITLDPPSAEYIGDYLLSNDGINDLEFTPHDSWVLAAGRQILYRNRVDNPSRRIESVALSPLAESFGGLAFAPDFETNTATVRIVVTESEAPVAVDDAYDTVRDEAITAPVGEGVLANDSDPQGDGIEAVLRQGPQHGTVDLAADGSFVYTPEAGFYGTDHFVYQADDGQHASNFATVTIGVDLNNAAPVAVDDAYVVDENGTLNVAAAEGVLGNDEDADGDDLTAALVQEVQHGTLEFQPDGSFSYTPEVGFIGSDTFSYVADDPFQPSNMATVTIEVRAVNDPPVAGDDHYETSPDTPLVIDWAGPVETEVFFDDFEAGAAAGWSNTQTDVTPVGERSFLGRFGKGPVSLVVDQVPEHTDVRVEFDLYVINSWDGNGGGPDVWTFNVNEAPVVFNATFSNVASSQTYPDAYPGGSHPARTGAAESNTLGYGNYGDAVYHLSFPFAHAGDSLQLNFRAIHLEALDNESWGLDNVRVVVSRSAGVLANDSDPEGDPLTAELVSGPSHGNVTLNPDGTFEYTPDPGYLGQDSFTYTANDGELDSNEATVTIDVTLANSIAGTVNNDLDGNGTVDPGEPPLEGWTVFVDENNNGLLDAGEISTVTDGDGNYRFLALEPGNYTLALELPDGWAQSLPRQGGDGTLTYVGTEGGGDKKLVRIAISEDGRNLYTVSHESDILTVWGRDPATGDLTWLQRYLNGEGGWYALASPLRVVVSPDGRHLYTTGSEVDKIAIWHRDPVSGLVTFLGAVEDGQGGVDGLDQVIGIAISPDGRHVYAGGLADNAVAVFDRDALTGGLTFVQVVKEGVGGEYGLSEPRDVAVSADGEIVVTASVGSDALSVFRRDPDTGALTFVGSYFAGPDDAYGLLDAWSVAISSDSTYIYASGRQSDALSVFRRDPATDHLQLIQLLRNGVGLIDGLDEPRVVEISPDGANLYIISFSGTMMVFDRDAETGLLTPAQTLRQGVDGVSGLGMASGLTVSPDGRTVYTSTVGDKVIGIFERDYVPSSQLVALADGQVAEGIDFAAHERIAPTAGDDEFTADEDGTLAIEAPGVLVNDTDANTAVITAMLETGPGHGTLDLLPEGSFTYTPEPEFFGTDIFTYVANDGFDDSNVATVTITVNPVEDLPLAVDDAYTAAQAGTLVVDWAGPAETEVFFDDFEAGAAAAWSETSIYITHTGWRRILGRFGNQEVALDLAGLPEHNEVVVELDLYLLDTWDGNGGHSGPGPDIWSLDVADGPTLLYTTFDNAKNPDIQAYPDNYLEGEHPSFTGAEEVLSLGDPFGAIAVYHLAYRFEHTADAIQFIFAASGLEALSNESWGIDNVRVAVARTAGVLANDSDADGDVLTAVLVEGPGNGTVVLNGDGTFEYTPEATFSGDDSFTYKANDGDQDSNVATVTITVAPDETVPVGELGYPAAGAVIDEDLGYVDVRWTDPGSPSAGIDAATIDTGDITVQSGPRSLSVDRVVDQGGGVWRYYYGDDADELVEGVVTVTLVAGEVADRAGNVNAEQTETFTFEPPPLAQIVWGEDAAGNPNQVAAVGGMPLSFTVRYTTNDNNPALTGLGLRMHFESDAITFDGLSDVLAGLVTDPQVIVDTDDLDGNPATDTFVLVSWYDVGGNWPGGTLPADLFVANFTAALAPDGTMTPLNFTRVSTASGYGLDAAPVAVSIQSGSLDVDDNGEADALSDGIVMLRYLFGFDGAALVQGALAPNAERTDPADIVGFLDNCRATMLDVDASGEADALTDGILILRYLFGFTDGPLITGALHPDAARTEAADIVAFLDQFNPGVQGSPLAFAPLGSESIGTVSPSISATPGDAERIDAVWGESPHDVQTGDGLAPGQAGRASLYRALALDALQSRPKAKSEQKSAVDEVDLLMLQR